MSDILNFDHCYLSYDFAQDGESLDTARDRELVEWPAEPFVVWDLLFVIFQVYCILGVLLVYQDQSIHCLLC